MNEEHAVTVRMPEGWLWLLRAGGAALGCALGFAVAPLVRWLVDLTGEAPGPLRLAAQLPTAWAVPVLTVVGAAAGVYLAVVTRRQSPAVIVAPHHLTVRQGTSARQVDRERVGVAFTDGRDLVLLDRLEHELVRIDATDLPTRRLVSAFEQHGFPWRGSTDPRETEFVRWVDGTPDLDAATHALLRTRKRALDDERTGAAEDALDELRARGVAVRDRGGVQQYRSSRTDRSGAEGVPTR
ncbi:MAG TPA: hypothetical protein VD903_02035 [Pseudonocardia sp.]|nr:hypothetical protein [Pseudonocardia sp.]